MLPTKAVKLLQIASIWTLVSGDHEFSIPEGCKEKNTKYPLSSVNWSCFVFNWNKMSCWFDIKKLFPHKIDPGESYNITVFYNINYLFPVYFTEVSLSDRCLRKIDFAGEVGDAIFNFTLKSSHLKESLTRVIQFDNKQVVKPDKIKGLQLYRTKSTIYLKWRCPSTHEGMEFRIRYRSEYEKNKNVKDWQERTYIWIMNYSDYIFHFYNDSLPSNCSITLTNLTAFTSYDFIIDVIPRNWTRSGFWSDAFTITVRTDDDKLAWIREGDDVRRQDNGVRLGMHHQPCEYNVKKRHDTECDTTGLLFWCLQMVDRKSMSLACWERDIVSANQLKLPQAVPEFYPGYYSSVNESYIKIYWKPIPRLKRCGTITNYRVAIKTLDDKESNKEILIPPTNVSSNILIDHNQINRIELTQMNRKGYPNISDAHIFVFPDYSRPKLPRKFKVQTLNTTSILLTWEISETDNRPFKELSTVTVVWCNGTLPNICFEPIASRIFPLHIESINTSTVILLGIGNYSEYIYGLSLEAETKEGLLISSGIHWFEDCIYHMNGGPAIRPVIERILPYNHNTVLVQWKPYNCQQSGAVIGSYLIRFCETKGKVCTGPYQTRNSSTDKLSYVLSDLLNGHCYSIEVGTEHKYEKTNGPWSEPVHYDVPEFQGFQQIGIVAGSVTAGVVAFVVLIIIGVRLLRHKCKKVDAETRIDYTVRIIKRPNATESECLLEKKKTFGDSGFDGSDDSRYNDADDSNVTRLYNLNNDEASSVLDGFVIDELKEQIYSSEHNNTSNILPSDSDMNDGTYREFITHSSDDDSDTSSTETDKEIFEVSGDGQQIQHEIKAIPDVLLPRSSLNDRSSLEGTRLTIDSYCKGYQITNENECIEPGCEKT